MDQIGKNPNEEERLSKLQEYHDFAVAKSNEKMIGRIPADEIGKRYPIAIMLSMMILFGLLLNVDIHYSEKKIHK